MVNAIIMASGLSLRMGTNKLLLPFKGKYLIEHVLDKVQICPFYQTVLVSNDEQILELGSDRGFTVINNKHAEDGQSKSIELGILNCLKADGYAFFTGDQPFLDINTINRLLASFNQNQECIIVPCYQSRSGTPVIFPKKYKNDLLALKGDKGGKSIIQQNFDVVKFIEVSEASILWDIDSKEDYQKLILGNR
ncbi:molybdenum cofactor cytidylyltransferase [Mycoplasmatota bacterium]|nr:molybdenum cofactor cytidylyltransferase [Mycoplasmatota bacterium]